MMQKYLNPKKNLILCLVMFKYFSLIVLLTSVFIFSCKKDGDDISPSISISSPFNNQQINGFDTLIIRGTITDNKNIKYVSVVLRNQNNINVLPTVSFEPNSPSFNLNTAYFFNDIHMPSGEYHFKISASDGENITNKFITIFYGEVPKERTGVFFYDNNGSSTSIYSLTGTNATLFKTLPGDFIGGAANSFNQQLLSVGSLSGNLTAVDVTFGDVLWEVSNSTSSTPFFMHLFFQNKEVYISLRNGEIRAYGGNGNPKFLALAFPNFFGEEGLVHTNLFVSEQKAIGNNDRRLSLYWTASGALVQQTTLFEDVLGLYSLSTNKIVLLANDNNTGNAKIQIYDISANAKSTPFSLAAFPIDDVEEINSGIYLIAQNGNLVLVNANSFSTLPYLSGVNATKIKYDAFTNELYVISGNTITVYDFSSKTIKGTYSHTSNVLDLVFLFNK
ncbi:MAG: hypothetical protein CVT95_06590 [Bacteroidetes bacterium HGW-Bacteroidetes-12]|nr:MAG: hypothetical protein CVT95_06590 [Bacteroidetes bacterium HGW-Bacteroidetes-12]